MAFDVVCIGNTFAEYLVYGYSEIPQTGQATTADELIAFSGGMALNTAASLLQLGIKPTIISKLGTGTSSSLVVKNLRGVDATHIIRSEPIATPKILTFVSRDSSRERKFVVIQQPSSALTMSDLRSKQRVLEEAKVIHFGDLGNIPAAEEVEMAGFLTSIRARNPDVIITSDIAALDRIKEERTQRSLKPFLSSIDYFFPSDVEASMITGVERDDYEEAAAIIHKRYGVKNLCVKLADAGVYVSLEKPISNIGQRTAIFDPFYVNNIIDRTGCGDAWCAGFISGVLTKQSADYCCLLGNACASICIRHKGPNGFTVTAARLKEMVLPRMKG